MGVSVDEPRRQRLAVETMLGTAGTARDGAWRPDHRDAIAEDSDVAGERIGAGAVIDQGTAKDVVVAAIRRRVAHRLTPAARGCA